MIQSPGNMLPASFIWKIDILALLVVWNTFFKWKIAAQDYFWHKTEYYLKKITWKTQGYANEKL